MMFDEPVDLDNSRLETYGLCAMKYHNRYNLGFSEPKGLNARFSSHLIHDPITEWYYRGREWEPSQAEWEERFAKIAITPDETKVKANAIYSWENAKRCFEFYRERFQGDHDRFKILGVEQYLIDRTIHPTIGFGSKPDIRAQELDTNKLWTLELKFSDWDFILEASTMNPQFLGQVNNTKGNGVIVTLIQPSGTKWSNFGAVREEIEPKPEELEVWRKETAFKIESVMKSYATNVWPRHTPHACTSYGGCFFVGLCTAGHPKEMVERMPRTEDALAYLTEGTMGGEEAEGEGAVGNAV